MPKDYYEILGLSKSATGDEIRRAYRTLAQKFHPDKVDSGDEKRFREVNEAYEVLSDDTKRSQYDRFGQTFSSQGGQGGFSGFNDFSDFARNFGQGVEFDFGDIFSDLFGGARGRQRAPRGVDLEMTLEIDFLESVFGVQKNVSITKPDHCPKCSGSGAEPGSKVNACSKCHGSGQIMNHRRTILGQIQQVEVCPECEGTGKIPEKPCSECRGRGVKKMQKTLEVNIPAGIEDGQRIKVAGEGEIGYRGSAPGDLFVAVRVRPHEKFVREGADIVTEVPVSFYQAALGAKIEIETVDGKVMLKIPTGSQSGKVLRLKGKGVPYLQSSGRGDHLAVVRVITPTKLTKKEKEIFRELAGEKGESVDIDESLWGKIKDSF